MAHTPRPWGIVFHGNVERIRLNGSTVYQVSDVTDPDFPSGEPRYCLDDLRLMAAAPEMLAACHRLVDADLAVEEDERKHQLKLARLLAAEAIAKAEGRVP